MPVNRHPNADYLFAIFVALRGTACYIRDRKKETPKPHRPGGTGKRHRRDVAQNSIFCRPRRDRNGINKTLAPGGRMRYGVRHEKKYHETGNRNSFPPPGGFERLAVESGREKNVHGLAGDPLNPR